MALNKTAFKAGLKILMNDLRTNTDDPAQATDDYADKLGDLIISLIQSGTITIPSTTVNVTGANSGGPVASTNAAPIIVVNGIT